MRLHADSVLPFARELVFRTYRDRLVELVPYLPNIRGITVEKRDDVGAVTKMVNVWKGGGDIPAAARVFLSEKMLSWTDHATWDESKWTCDWRMEAHSFTEAVHASGQNRFVPDGDGTRFTIEGELTIDGKKLPIPRFLAGSVGPAVEKFLVGMIKPNLTETARGVERFLADEAKKKTE